MLAATRKAIISTASKATYATAATASQITTAANGVKVASSQEPGQTASLAVVVNGGARAESGSNAGVAHFLKNYGFKVIHTTDALVSCASPFFCCEICIEIIEISTWRYTDENAQQSLHRDRATWN